MAVPVKNLKKTHTEPSLKAALLRLMKVKPLAKVTIKELCEEAKVYRSTFYCHYASVEQLLAAIQNDVLNELNRAYGALASKSVTVNEYVVGLLEYVKSGKYDFDVLLGNSGPEADEYRTRFIVHLADQVNSFYTDLDCPMARKYNAIYATTGALAIVSKWVVGGYVESVEDIAAFIIKLGNSVHDA